MLTAEIYKEDRRCKSGERLVLKKDYAISDKVTLDHLVRTTYPARDGYRFEIHETYVTRKNLMGGAEFQERYDTPYYCSPSSETYWSM
jgi:hypothetical protein